VFQEISTYFLHFDGNINFLEQPEFEEKKTILSFLSLTQRQDKLSKLMQIKGTNKDNYNIILGDEFNNPELSKFVLIYAKYYVFGIPGYLGVLSPVRMNYRKAIPIIRDIANTITSTTKKGMVVPAYEK
ncbi:MAG: heat-inducible transcription repressor HrcA, partial [Candidatus Cloacimonadota bacterium]|nr:heat-inducible transcription repressor HrcA [Candidatus Cloacimonadota bacterium]